MGLDEPVDLETWRIWYGKMAVVIGTVFLPLGIAISVPVLIDEGYYLNIIIDLSVWVIIASRLFSRADRYKGNAYTVFVVINIFVVFLFVNLGPTHARPAWLVMCAVISSLMFGKRGAIASTVLNMIILVVIYWIIGPENKAWAAEYSSTYGKWVMFIVNVSLITLACSLPVGFMLDRLDQSLKHEREIRGSLSEERQKLMAANISLEKEIEQRKKTQEALASSEEKYRLLIENIPSVTWITNEHGKTTYISPNVQSIYGLSPEEIYNQGDEIWFGRIHPDDKDRVRSSFLKMFDLDQEFDLEYRIQRMDGKWIWLHDKGVKAFVENGIRYAYGIFSDVTDQKNSEEKLRESEKYLELLFEYAPDGYYLVDQEGCFLNWNKTCEQITGYGKEEIIGKRFLETSLVSPDQMKKAASTFEKYRQGLPSGPEEVVLSHKDGSRVLVEINTYPIKIQNKIQLLGIARDITERMHAEEERERLEKQLKQAQKMEALGTLAGGIAHDFNNILTGIMGFSELAILEAGKGTSLEKKLNGVLNAGDRAKNLVKQILTFSRYTEPELKPVHVKSLVKEVLKLIRASLPSTIEIHQQINSDSLIMADPVQVHQVMMNLCTNAGQAMMMKGGILEVDLTNVELTADFLKGNPEMNPGTHMKITVRDTGEGIPPDIIDRIFEPYFTTKEHGKGTGLGLSVVHGIIKSYKGAIIVRSEPGRGTTIEVYLPVIQFENASDQESEEHLPMGKECILLVDDEPVIEEVGKEMLERLGYKVTARTSSFEALELFKAQPERFDLVITDATMPVMTGEALAGEIIKVRPDIPIILCTGFSPQINRQKAAQLGIKAFIMKPFVLKEISIAVYKALGKA